MNLRLRQLTLLLSIVGSLAFLGACADDPATTPGGEPIVFTGRLKQGERINRPLLLEEEGTIRIEVTDLTPVLIELPPEASLPSLTMGVGIGTLGGEECNITFGSSLAEGDNMTVLVEGTTKCLLFFDDGSLPLDAIISYTVMVDDVKSN